jgi:hypothetical protein
MYVTAAAAAPASELFELEELNNPVGSGGCGGE